MIIVLPLSGISLLPMPEPNSYLYILLFLNVILYNYKCHRVTTLVQRQRRELRQDTALQFQPLPHAQPSRHLHEGND